MDYFVIRISAKNKIKRKEINYNSKINQHLFVLDVISGMVELTMKIRPYRVDDIK